jgi:hypothetical protein
MTISYPVTTIKEFKAKFGLKNRKITPIIGRPTLKTLLHAHQQLQGCAINCKPGLGQFCYLYLVEPKAVYNTYSNHLHNEPANPGVAPDLANLIMVGVFITYGHIKSRSTITTKTAIQPSSQSSRRHWTRTSSLT